MAADASDWVPNTRSVRTLAAAARDCRGCDLYRDTTQTVFGAGPARARAVLVGEQPGDVEDREGVPFVGPAGRVLDRALDDAHLDRDTLYVTNAVKHFRHEDRGKRRLHKTPQAAHITACRPWLAAELRVVKPELLVLLGAVATRSVLGPAARVQRDRGAVRESGTELGTLPTLITIHPSAVLRSDPDERARAYDGLVADLSLAERWLA